MKIRSRVMIQPGMPTTALRSRSATAAPTAAVSARMSASMPDPHSHHGCDSGTAPGFEVTPTGERFVHATTQEHGIGDRRQCRAHERPASVSRSQSIDDYKKNPKVIEEMRRFPRSTRFIRRSAYDKGISVGHGDRSERRAPAATPAWSPARRKTIFRWWARTR